MDVRHSTKMEDAGGAYSVWQQTSESHASNLIAMSLAWMRCWWKSGACKQDEQKAGAEVVATGPSRAMYASHALVGSRSWLLSRWGMGTVADWPVDRCVPGSPVSWAADRKRSSDASGTVFVWKKVAVCLRTELQALIRRHMDDSARILSRTRREGTWMFACLDCPCQQYRLRVQSLCRLEEPTRSLRGRSLQAALRALRLSIAWPNRKVGKGEGAR